MIRLSKQEYLAKAKAYAISRGGECLSKEYVDYYTKLEWKCSNVNHSPWFSIKYSVMKMRTWCPQCAIAKSTSSRTNINGLKIAKAHALKKGGQCLSAKYLGARQKLNWKCSENEHSSWEATYTNVIDHDKWCPECAGYFSPDKLLTKANIYAKKREGKCLSLFCTSTTKQKLEWKCENPLHKSWKTTLSMITRGSWCPECGNEKNSLSKLLINGLHKAKEEAKKKGGQCLSTTYEGNNKKMLWKCENPNHKPWETAYATIKGGTWCPYCYGLLTNEEYLEKAKNKAISNGGLCLSKKYINNSMQMLWICGIRSHPAWNATYANVVNHNRWCSKCAEYFYKEDKVRLIMEYLLDTSFKKIKPKWNKNPKTGFLLELDGYSEEYNIAFEFQGRHHYQIAFGKNEDNLEYVKFKDEAKKINCLLNNVKLLIIRDNDQCKDAISTLNYILQELKAIDVKISKYIDLPTIDKLFNTMSLYQEKYLIKAREYAKSKGGECLSKEYVNKETKLEWKCNDKNHPSWFRGTSIITNRNWCRKCSKVK